MIAFVKETEPLLDKGQGQVIRPDERMFASRGLFLVSVQFLWNSFCHLFQEIVMEQINSLEKSKQNRIAWNVCLDLVKKKAGRARKAHH